MVAAFGGEVNEAPPVASGPAQGRAHAARGKPRGRPAHVPAASSERKAEALTLAYGLASQAGAWLWCWPDNELAGQIAMDRDEAEALAEPTANLMRGSKLLSRYGDLLVNHEDWLKLFAAAYVYGERVTPLLVEAGRARASRATVRRAERDARQAERVSQATRPRERRGQRPADVGSGNVATNGSAPFAGIPAHLLADR